MRSISSLRISALLCAGLLAGSLLAPAECAPARADDATAPAVQKLPDQNVLNDFTGLMSAMSASSYDDFVRLIDDDFKKTLQKDVFDKSAQSIAPRLAKGYDTTYLTQLNQRGTQVYLWKLTFKDGSDDVLAYLSIKNGQVDGFMLL